MARALLYLVLCMTTNAVWAENTVEGRMDCSYTSQSQALKGIYAFKVEDLPIEYCTHIIYSHISFEESSMTIIPSNPEYDVGYNGWDKFIDLKKVNPNLKLLMRVERAADFIETAENRKDLIDAIVSFLTQHKFDGVTIPWLSSWMDGPEVDGLYEFFEELRRSFETAGHPTWEANLIVPIDDNSINSERICKVADSVSLIGILLPSFYRTTVYSPMNRITVESGEVGDMSIKDYLQKWLDVGCPKNKIILGVNYAVQTFTLEDPTNNGLGAPVSGCGESCPLLGNDGVCAYFELCQKFELCHKTSWTFKWDEDAAAPYAFQGDQWVAYENATSIEQKAAFARTKGLGGVLTLNLAFDDYRGICGEKYPLTKALWKGFYAKSTP